MEHKEWSQMGSDLLAYDPFLGQIWVSLAKINDDVGDLALKFHDSKGFSLVFGPQWRALPFAEKVDLLGQQLVHLLRGHWQAVTFLPMDDKWPLALFFHSRAIWHPDHECPPFTTLYDWYLAVSRETKWVEEWEKHPEWAHRYRFWRKPEHKLATPAEVRFRQSAVGLIRQIGSAGSLSGNNILELVAKKESSNPISWRRVLHMFVHRTGRQYIGHTHHRPSRRYPDSPGLRKKSRVELAVIIDTSASIPASVWHRFFVEVSRLAETKSEVTLIEADARVQRISAYHRGIPKQVKGGGGTFFDPALQEADRTLSSDGIIYFTDGDGPLPRYRPTAPVLWVLTRRRSGWPGRTVILPEKNASNAQHYF